MTATLFDMVEPSRHTHACGGPACRYCEMRDAPAAKAAALAGVVRDMRWWKAADDWLDARPSNVAFTADDLLDDIGLPDGSSNQVGARLRAWKASDEIYATEYVASRRPSNHGRVLMRWAKS